MFTIRCCCCCEKFIECFLLLTCCTDCINIEIWLVCTCANCLAINYGNGQVSDRETYNRFGGGGPGLLNFDQSPFLVQWNSHKIVGWISWLCIYIPTVSINACAYTQIRRGRRDDGDRGNNNNSGSIVVGNKVARLHE